MSKTHADGAFCWVELGTSDAAGAKTFYRKLFGWEPVDAPMGGGHTYTMLNLNGKEAGALYELMPEQKQQGVPPHWLPYIASSDVDAAAKKIKEAGGVVVAGPFDVAEHGRMAIARDPTGGTFGVWQEKSHAGSTAGNGPGTHSWTELVTNDVDAARRFYAAAFGYEAETAPVGGVDYTTLLLNNAPAAGIFGINEQMQGVPVHWMVYFNVNDPDEIHEQATSMGAKTLVPPTDIPGIGRFSQLTDPQGAAFAVIRMTAGAAA